jgi:hypothetical protein
MKNIQLSSRDTDLKVLMALLCAGSAAIMGLCVAPPVGALDDTGMHVFDATICATLAILVWAIFHLCNLQHLNGLPLGAAILGSMLFWLLLVIGLMILIRAIAADNTVDLTTAILMRH